MSRRENSAANALILIPHSIASLPVPIKTAISWRHTVYHQAIGSNAQTMSLTEGSMIGGILCR
jgi:hypothetical protein